MPTPRAPYLAALLLTACGEPRAPDPTAGGSTTSTTGDATDGATATSAAPTTDALASTTTDATTTGATTTASTTTATTTTATTADTTTGAGLCDLVELTCAAAELLGPVLDCGIVDPWNNTIGEWQAAVDCALNAATAQQPFKLIVWLQGIDSDVGTGYFGVAAESYQPGTIFYDSYPPASAVERSCSALVATPNCEVAQGAPCITCEGASEGVDRCQTQWPPGAPLPAPDPPIDAPRVGG